ncbi:hypothetical protein, partial [Acidovorax sp. Root275]|uniref:hypothetical protein n=1 Tax=Acidovorax sp. Root275 TaxID=1736508 RepID=UPI0019D6E8BD
LGYWQAPQRRRPPAKTAARRGGAKSGDWPPRLLAWAWVHAAHPKHPLIPIALQCDPCEIVNTFQALPPRISNKNGRQRLSIKRW